MQTLRPSTGYASSCSRTKADTSSGARTPFASPTVVAQTAAIPVASLKAGYRFPLSGFPVGTSERFVRLNYVVAGTMTAGTITAAVTAGVSRYV